MAGMGRISTEHEPKMHLLCGTFKPESLANLTGIYISTRVQLMTLNKNISKNNAFSGLTAF